MKKEWWQGLLPMGSVVRLKNADRSLMIMGRSQTPANDEYHLYDYAGVIYPEGYLDKNNIALFDHDDIEEIRYVGYMDMVYRNFSEIIEAIHAGLKDGEITMDDAKEILAEMQAAEEG